MGDFHKIWIEQCEAAEGIKEQFGAQDAARYLIGEKLLRFLQASHGRPEFADELPKFMAEIKRVIAPHEIVEVLDDLQAGAVPDPVKIFRGDLDDEELDEHDVQYDCRKNSLDRKCQGAPDGIRERNEFRRSAEDNACLAQEQQEPERIGDHGMNVDQRHRT